MLPSQWEHSLIHPSPPERKLKNKRNWLCPGPRHRLLQEALPDPLGWVRYLQRFSYPLCFLDSLRVFQTLGPMFWPPRSGSLLLCSGLGLLVEGLWPSSCQGPLFAFPNSPSSEFWAWGRAGQPALTPQGSFSHRLKRPTFLPLCLCLADPFFSCQQQPSPPWALSMLSLPENHCCSSKCTHCYSLHKRWWINATYVLSQEHILMRLCNPCGFFFSCFLPLNPRPSWILLS